MPKADASGTAIDYALRGNGPSLLMIAGFRRSRVIWFDPLLNALAARFQLVLMDNRGTGHSDKPQNGYSIERFADDCAAVLDHAGIARAHVFGVSMGGMIAQRLAQRHPSKVHGLALGCTHCGKTGAVPAERRIWELLRLTPDDRLSPKEVAYRQEEAYFVPAFRAANRPLLDRLFEMVSQNPTPPHAVQGHLKAIDGFEGCGDMGRIAAPTLVITGDSDPLIPPENSRILANGIPGARLCVLKNASHFFWVEKPEETAAVLTEFFSRLE
jgi:pimeloyl-ACP methyl ester carboxylesterase